ncbi:SpoIIE family protein phosphatase [Streptomyces ureilyticus]|uniref:SpoIIE family protein phosphatase n=1 Tax=Streptomyces ureilyticus TaxID=1775131 RepID=UPI001F2C59A9|nr:SpoIIE family protein phosphatase [Streptomyces ureilyticus]
MARNEQLGQAPPAAAEAQEAVRMHVLRNTGDGQTQAEALQLALHHAVADLGGLGGMVHLRIPGDSRPLHLAVTGGLPREFAQQWGTLGWQDETAPIRALRDSALVWLPTTDTQARALPAGTGIAAVPLLAAEGSSLGVLSVVTVSGAPSVTQRDLLEALARWVCERLAHPAPTTGSLNPAWWNAEHLAGPRLQQAREAVRVGTWDQNLRTGDVVYDETTMAILGIDPETFDGRVDTVVGLVHPDDLPRVVAAVDRAIRQRGEYAAEYRLCRSDGSVVWIEARAQVVLGEDGEPAHFVGTVWDTTQKRAALDSVGHSLLHMSDGFLTVDADWRIEFVNLHAERLLGPSQQLFGRVLWDVPGTEVPGLEDRCRQAAATGAPTGFDVQWPTNRRWYHLRLVPSPDGVTVFLTDVTETRLADEQRAAAQRAAARRTTHIGRLNAALADAVTVSDVVDTVAERVLPLVGATGLFVQLVDGESLRVAGSAGYSQEFLDNFPKRMSVSDHTPVSDAVRHGAPQYLRSRREFRDRYPEVAGLAFSGGKNAWAFLPLIVSGRPVGCLVISFSRPRRFSEEDRALLTALSGLIAQALERARLYDAEHTRSQELQRGLLPLVLPSLPAVTAAAHYVPATEGLEVGGDWYDVIPLSAERVALVIGDVMGHGLSEAATMGRLRTAVHTLVGLELPPDELFSHLNDLVSDLGDDFYATCLYAVYDPATQICTVVRAGHPPPALLHPDGTVHFPQLPQNPPLGAATPPFETVELTVPEGSLIVLYTDGLVESAARDIDSGMAHLAKTLTDAQMPNGRALGATTADRDADARRLDQLCTALISALVPAKEQTSDDTAVLVARTHPLAAGNVASWELPEDPIAAGQARDYVRHQLTEWHLDDLTWTTELIASELVGNVIRHARGPVQLRLIRSRSLICEVTDGSLTTPHIRRALETDEGNRGLQLIAALTQRWGTRHLSNGKCIWTEQLLP